MSSDEVASSETIILACTDPLKRLKRIGIKDLVLYEPARGKYLLVRIINPPPLFGGGISIYVEDHLGDVIGVLLYNYIDYDSIVLPIEDLLPVGSVYVLKQPLLKKPRWEVVVRCDCPSDFVRVDRNHSMFKSASKIKWKHTLEPRYVASSAVKNAVEWKAEGNGLFNQRKYRDALEAYFVALKMSVDPSITLVLQNNISAACLHLGRFEESLSSANSVLTLEKDNTKALFRAGKAHYGLRQYKEALLMFEGVLKVDPTNQNALTEKKRCEERCREQKGHFDITKLYISNRDSPDVSVEFGDYIGPIKVAEVEEKGRGIVASRDIKLGTVLLVSKALQASLTKDLNSNFSFTLPDAFPNQGNNIKLLAKTCHLILNNPNTFGKQIYSLHTSDLEYDKSFKVFCDESNKSEPIADAERLIKIFNENSFGRNHTDLNDFTRDSTGSLIFILASYFNHSCISNAFWHIYNDVIVIRSSKFIRKGSEITIPYHSSWSTFLTRDAENSRRGFRCMCVLCKLDQCEPSGVHQKRLQLYRKYEELLEKYPDHTRKSAEFAKKIRNVIGELEMSYGERTNLKVHLHEPYLKLAQSLQIDNSNESELTEAIEKAFQCLGLSSEILFRFAEKENPVLPQYAIISPIFLELSISLTISRYQDANMSDSAVNWMSVMDRLERVFYECTLGTRNIRFKKTAG